MSDNKTVICPYCGYCSSVPFWEVRHEQLCCSREGCGRLWTHHIVVELFGQEFADRIKIKKERLWSEKELTLTVLTQPLVQQEVLNRQARNELEKARRKRSKLLKDPKNQTFIYYGRNPTMDKKELRSIIKIQYKLTKLQVLITNYKNYLEDHSFSSRHEKSERNYLMPCPDSSCRGWVNDQWECVMCGYDKFDKSQESDYSMVNTESDTKWMSRYLTDLVPPTQSVKTNLESVIEKVQNLHWKGKHELIDTIAKYKTTLLDMDCHLHYHMKYLDINNRDIRIDYLLKKIDLTTFQQRIIQNYTQLEKRIEAVNAIHKFISNAHNYFIEFESKYRVRTVAREVIVVRKANKKLGKKFLEQLLNLHHWIVIQFDKINNNYEEFKITLDDNWKLHCSEVEYADSEDSEYDR